MASELENRISIALAAYHSNPGAKVAPIARAFDIPYQTFLGRIKGRKSKYGRPSTNNALEPEQEKAPILWINTLDHAFSPPNSARIREAALQIVQRHNPSRTLGKNWVYKFLARMPPEWEWKTSKTIERARFEAADPGYVTSWYDRLQITIKTYGITEKNLYYFDETGFKIGQGKAEKVVSARDNFHHPTGGQSESLIGILFLSMLYSFQGGERSNDKPIIFCTEPSLHHWSAAALFSTLEHAHVRDGLKVEEHYGKRR